MSAATESVRRQAEAYLALLEAKVKLAAAERELADAEGRRWRPNDSLTVVVNDTAVTSSRAVNGQWSYVCSRVLQDC